VWPRPYQQPIRVWHGSATSKESVDLAARYGDPLFSANVTNPIEPYAELIRYYRERWEHYGHDPADIAVGAGTAGLYAARTSQEALAAYRPVFEGNLAFQRSLGLEPVFPTLEDFVERSSALIGSPQQIIDKVHRYHERFGHTVLHLHADASGLDDAQHRDSLERFQSEVAPVLRREIPDPPFAWEPVLATPEAEAEPASGPVPEPVFAPAPASVPADR
jgi:alkanesulfonate monooxygenase SsuD/methylene tetrahydromethanopterin reductase-like flavin-dependent oxidoreductase (luciferase family)